MSDVYALMYHLLWVYDGSHLPCLGYLKSTDCWLLRISTCRSKATQMMGVQRLTRRVGSQQK